MSLTLRYWYIFNIVCLALPFPYRSAKVSPASWGVDVKFSHLPRTFRVYICNCSVCSLISDKVGNIKRNAMHGQKCREKICRVPIVRDILVRVLLGSARAGFVGFLFLFMWKIAFAKSVFKKVFSYITLGWNGLCVSSFSIRQFFG